MNFDAIISNFTSQKELAGKLSVDYSTISQWKRRGRIPTKRIQQILALAALEGIQISAEDFFVF